MAGSIKWFQYVDNDGVLHGVKLDKSNAGVLGFVDPSATLDPLPRGWKMRKVNCIATTGEGAGWYRRSFPCGRPDATAYTTSATFIAAGITWQPVSTSGESKRRTFVFDTNLTDA